MTASGTQPLSTHETATDNTPVAVITGAARRIGATLAKRFHAANYRIIVHFGNSSTEAQQLADELNGIRPDSAVLIQANLIDSDSRQQLIDASLAQWGRIDLLINNASSFYPKSVAASDETVWDDLMGTNLKAPFFLAQGFAEALQQTGGNIINIVDIHSQRPLKGYPVYSAAKAGLAMLTQSLAKELAPHIRVNGVSPGPILLPEGDNTAASNQLLEKTPLQRMGCPDDIADTALFIAQQNYITGQIIAVDGGKSLYS